MRIGCGKLCCALSLCCLTYRSSPKHSQLCVGGDSCNQGISWKLFHHPNYFFRYARNPLQSNRPTWYPDVPTNMKCFIEPVHQPKVILIAHSSAPPSTVNLFHVIFLKSFFIVTCGKKGWVLEPRISSFWNTKICLWRMVGRPLPIVENTFSKLF